MLPVLDDRDLDRPAALTDPPEPLTAHLVELRRRLIHSLLFLAAGTALCYRWSGTFLSWLAKPAGTVVFTHPTEAFMARLKVAAWAGFLVALPLILHQAWMFVSRALEPRLRRLGLRVVPAAYLLFLMGSAIAVLVVVPAAMRFLLTFGTEDIRPLMTLSGYLGFTCGLALAFGGVFQLPVALFVLNRTGWVSRRGLAGRRRYVYLLSFVAAALLTPGPDVFSQAALAVPAILIFELTLLVLD